MLDTICGPRKGQKRRIPFHPRLPPLMKTYLRYVPTATFGVVVSPEAGKAALEYVGGGRAIAAAALQSALVHQPRTGALLGGLCPSERPSSGPGSAAADPQVVVLASAAGGALLAVGSDDGSIAVYGSLGDVANAASAASGAVGSAVSVSALAEIDMGKLGLNLLVRFRGHRGAVSALAVDRSGSGIMLSGGRDTDVVAWDIAGERGLVRLVGHKDAITDLALVHKGTVAISASKDGLVKVWVLETQQCVQTVVGHRAEVWAMAVDRAEQRLVTGTTDNLLRFWSIDSSVRDETPLKPMGQLQRSTQARVISIRYHSLPDGSELVGVLSADKTLQIFRVRSEASARKKQQRRAKRRREKAKAAKAADGEIGEGGAAADDDVQDEDDTLQPVDIYESVHIIRTRTRMIGFTFHPTPSATGHLDIAVALKNNTIEVHRVGAEDVVLAGELESMGHRSDVRSLALSTDDTMIASGSSHSVKVWNTNTRVCIRTCECEYALCMAFVPGDKHLLVGTKSGEVLLYELSSAALLERVDDAHDGAVYSIAVRPNGKGFVTGGADKAIKFWDFALVEDQQRSGRKRLGMDCIHIMQMADDVLSATYSPNGAYVAVALLDCTVKVFYADTLKFFLSLYGHKLAVLAFDISSDATLLASGSADKNLKIWGLDFGDCHKSFFAHDDNITAVRFVPNTHYLFTASKDRRIKYWDCDKFVQITSLDGHHGDIWALAISSKGDRLFSAGHDRSLRVWEKTQEQVFLEEERENELDRALDGDNMAQANDLQVATVDMAKEKATQASELTIKFGEQLVEAIELAEAERMRLDDDASAPPNIMLMGRSPADHVLATLGRIRSADLEDALMVLPFAVVVPLFSYLREFIQRGVAVDFELCWRVAFFLLRVHNSQLVATGAINRLFPDIVAGIKQRIGKRKDTIGFNLAGLTFLRREMESNKGARFFKAAEEKTAGRVRSRNSHLAAQAAAKSSSSKRIRNKRRRTGEPEPAAI